MALIETYIGAFKAGEVASERIDRMGDTCH